MELLSEYRDSKLVKRLLYEIKNSLNGKWMIMEICGGQTHSLVKNGLISMLPEGITMIHGPGCPVCVTPLSMIDKAVELSLNKEVILCSFGDMIRVPGSKKSLLQARSEGGNLNIVYSPLDAVSIALANPDKEVIFFAVGFETTAPANALALLQASRLNLNNFSLLASHVLVPPAMEAILDDEFNSVNAFLAAGHVCTVMGIKDYYSIAEKYKSPIVVTGFEPVDLLEGILMTVQQLEAGRFEVLNQYSRVVQPDGNSEAQKIVQEVFEIADREWRGIGTIPLSGYKIREKYRRYDAEFKFNTINTTYNTLTDQKCIAGEILKGIKKPKECPHFGKECTPLQPVGAPMVSTEGACAAYYHYNKELNTL